MNVKPNFSLQRKFSRIRDVHMEAFVEKYKNLLKWKSNERILDIGCGTGDLTYKYVYPLLPPDFSKFILTDVSDEALTKAKEFFDEDPRVEFENLDVVCELQKELEGKFDHIFSAFCLMWINDQKKAFENIYKLLIPGGGCFLVLVSKHFVPDIVYELLEKPKWKKFVPDVQNAYPFPYRSEADPVKTVEKLMKTVGFVNVKVYLEETTFAFYDEEEFLGFFESFPNPMGCMTPEEKGDYLKEALELAYARKVINKSGRKGESASLMVIYGEK
ncbi:juvenile hormone acid O-methyltransferase-like [Lutzomyia longipalpis]|uniref:juvenile hormone acid O-methyltransferase-like n=1 Tax=Lutzomyia longipalpis TaxID=7200 RepID=UPI002483531C|nr:juvenile hormone acid O-methyltransferase-like [Lutzomyia longipalpis]